MHRQLLYALSLSFYTASTGRLLRSGKKPKGSLTIGQCKTTIWSAGCTYITSGNIQTLTRKPLHQSWFKPFNRFLKSSSRSCRFLDQFGLVSTLLQTSCEEGLCEKSEETLKNGFYILKKQKLNRINFFPSVLTFFLYSQLSIIDTKIQKFNQWGKYFDFWSSQYCFFPPSQRNRLTIYFIS